MRAVLTMIAVGAIAGITSRLQVRSEEPGTVHKEIRAERFVVQSAGGEEVGTFGVAENGSGVISIKGPGESPRASIIASTEQVTLKLTNARGIPQVQAFIQPNGGVAMTILDERGNVAASFATSPAGARHFQLQAGEKPAGLSYYLEQDGKQALVLDAFDGNRVELNMTSRTGGSMRIVNDSGAAVFSAP